jgi:hypothetical protein
MSEPTIKDWCLRAVNENSFPRIVRRSRQGGKYREPVPVGTVRHGYGKTFGRYGECADSSSASFARPSLSFLDVGARDETAADNQLKAERKVNVFCRDPHSP